ncbi:DUF4234 domain-containing protein [Thermotoga sp. KOL6]|uniref:DUF4234 domain-containing protein n=1 Tax=Thermotoga sp. KOL6 TaxID=126741 RepID=UPI001E54D33B|nr:DUF4234 domain-containing protein [Thermotoga sp. KOL6]
MNVNLAWIGVVLSVLSSILLVEYYREFLVGNPNHVVGLAILFLSTVSVFSLLIVYRQWAFLLNENALKTLELARRYSMVINEKPLVPGWSYSTFVVFWFLGFLFPEVWIFSLLQIVFFVVFLHFLFETIKKLQDLKRRLYRTIFDAEFKSTVKDRNVLSVFLLTILTLGVYWFYLVIKLSQEINNFLDTDDQMMRNLEVKM